MFPVIGTYLRPRPPPRNPPPLRPPMLEEPRLLAARALDPLYAPRLPNAPWLPEPPDTSRLLPLPLVALLLTPGRPSVPPALREPDGLADRWLISWRAFACRLASDSRRAAPPYWFAVARSR